MANTILTNKLQNMYVTLTDSQEEGTFKSKFQLVL